MLVKSLKTLLENTIFAPWRLRNNRTIQLHSQHLHLCKNLFAQKKDGPAASNLQRVPKMMSLLEIEKSSLAHFLFVVFCLAVLFSTTLTVAKLNLISSKDFNIFPNYLLAYYRSLVAPAFCGIFFTAWFYSKNNLWQKVWDQVLDEVY